MAYTLTYTLNSDGNSYTLSGYSGDEPTGALVIPDSYNSKPVTIIGDYAFHGCSGLTSITIPDSVTSIGTEAFSSCSGLTSFAIGNGVTSISEGMFGYCSALTSIIIPASVTSIGNSAFSSCSNLTDITIGNGVTSIGSYAFYSCTELTSVTIPNSVTSIGDRAFYGCSGLIKINMLPTTPPTIQSRTLVTTVQSICVPAKCRKDYITATNWKNYTDKITEFPMLDLSSLLMYNNKVKARIDAIEEKKRDKNDSAGISNPNLLINPDFSINQRGQASYTGTEYGVDRWKCGYGIITVLDKGIKHTSVNTWQGVQQIIENPSRLAGKTLTISANGRASSGGMFRIYLYYQYSGQTRITACTANTQSTTDTTISATGTIPSDITDNDRVYVMLYNSLANVDFYCNWVKLEIGSVATTFMPPLIAEELPKCQRYYLKLQASATYTKFGYGDITGTSGGDIQLNIPRTMRTTPTIIVSSGFNLYERPTAIYSPVTNAVVRSITAAAAIIRLTTSGTAFTTNNLCVLQSSSTDDSIQLDAEL